LSDGQPGTLARDTTS